MHVDVALAIDDAVMQQIHLGHVHRQRTEGDGLDREQLAGRGAQRAPVCGIDPVAPGMGFDIEVLKVSELPPREEVVFDEVKTSFDFCGSVGVTDFMRHKVGGEAISKRRH